MAWRTRFTAEDGALAHAEWGANCGPGALAAITGLTLDEVRTHMGDFERKGYTNPTLMLAALKSIGAVFEAKKLPQSDVHQALFPRWGLARIQWEGPWTKPGVPLRARYRHTHWVGAARRRDGEIGVFDINAMLNGSGWVSLDDWIKIIVPAILAECVPRADGRWHLTHAIEVTVPAAMLRRGAEL